MEGNPVNRSKSSVKRKILVLGTPVTLLSVALAACGSSGQNAANSTKTPLSLTIGLPVVATVSAEIWLGQTQGFFKKHGVDVSISNAGATAGTEAAAGRVDVTQQGCSGALAPAASGHQTSIIYWMVGNVNAAVQVPVGSSLKAKATTAATVMELAGKRVAVQGVGGGAYGVASSLNAYVRAHGGKPLTIVNLSSSSAITAQLISGQVDAAVGANDELAGSLAAKKLRILVDASDPTMKQITGGDVAGVCLWGLKSQLQGKPQAVAAFVAGLRDSYKYITATSPSVIAQDLHGIKDFSPLSLAAIQESLSYDLPFMTPSAGFLSAGVWQNTLKAFAGWGTGLTLSDSEFSYQNIIDMSYWNAATKLLGNKNPG